MKVAKSKVKVEITGDMEIQDFGIVFDRHMVNILSNQLYEDKVLALVRELSTNALDSQREAFKLGLRDEVGTFDVHLPCWSDMNFWIRDYGTGMSPDKIKNTYSKYGASDRNESNDFTGCMGLGSKTPFCYNTKTFTVDSWHEGTHYQYSCFLNEEGMPQIAKMTEELSDEPSGVKITLPAGQGDRYDFQDAARRIYRFFTVTPNISGDNVNIEKPAYELEDDNWKYTEEYDESMTIVMGDVGYEVSSSALGDLTSAQRKVVGGGFHIYVDIGEVSVTASREGLDYTNRTKTHVRSYINNIIKSFNEKAQVEIDKCENLWEARLKFVEYERDSLRGIFDASKILYDGKPLSTGDDTIDWNQMQRDGKVEANIFEYNTYRKIERRSCRFLRIGNNPVFYENDLKVGGYVRSAWKAKEGQRTVLLVNFDSPADKAAFCELMGFDESYFTPISTIPSPTVRQSGVKRGKTSKVVQFRNSEAYYKSHCWSNTQDIDINDGGIYVEFNRFSVRFKGGMEHPKVLRRYVRALEDMGLTIPPIYGVKTANLKKFEDHTEWTSFFEWAVAQVSAAVAGKDLTSKQIYKNSLDNIGYTGYNSNRQEIMLIHQIAEHCCANTELAKFSAKVKEVQELAKGSDTARSMRTACEIFGVDIPDSTVQAPALRALEDAVYEKYPLLKKVELARGRSTTNNLCVEHIGVYVDAIG